MDAKSAVTAARALRNVKPFRCNSSASQSRPLLPLWLADCLHGGCQCCPCRLCLPAADCCLVSIRPTAKFQLLHAFLEFAELCPLDGGLLPEYVQGMSVRPSFGSLQAVWHRGCSPSMHALRHVRDRSAAHADLSVAAKKGTSSAVETEPGAGLRSGLRWRRKWGRNACLPLSGRIVLAFDQRGTVSLAFDLEDDRAFDQAVEESHRQWAIDQVLCPFVEVHVGH